jgi:hypothetical protein
MKTNQKLALAVLAGVSIGVAGAKAMLARQVTPPPVYVISEVDAMDLTGLQKYGEKVPDTLAPFNGHYHFLVSGGAKTPTVDAVGVKPSLEQRLYPTKTSALKQLAALGIDVNNEQLVKVVTLTLAKLVEHYKENELTENCGKTARTIEFITTNPISLVRQSSIRRKEPEILSPEEVCALLEELDEPFRTIVYVVAVTGMRRGELFGLKWGDVDLQNGQLKIVRSIVDQKVGETKTRGSKGRMPLPNDAVVALRNWKDATQYEKKDDWVFASPQALGEFPYWPNTVMVRHVQPAADRAGIGKRIGWHTRFGIPWPLCCRPRVRG